MKEIRRMGDPLAPPPQATWLNWIPIPARILASDGSTVAVNEPWASVLPAVSEGAEWLDVVELPLRTTLWARLRLAVAAGEPGTADCQVTGPHGSRWSRWWWHPAPPQNLVVCVAVIEDDRITMAPPQPGDAGNPPARAPLPADPNFHLSADLAAGAVHRVFEAGLALQSAVGLLDGPLAALAHRALDDLDQLIGHIRSAAFEQQTRPATPPPPDQAP
jgi:hypothetical protein